jgi:hypothetical protein
MRIIFIDYERNPTIVRNNTSNTSTASTYTTIRDFSLAYVRPILSITGLGCLSLIVTLSHFR